jgi:hypothetical protein
MPRRLDHPQRSTAKPKNRLHESGRQRPRAQRHPQIVASTSSTAVGRFASSNEKRFEDAEMKQISSLLFAGEMVLGFFATALLPGFAAAAGALAVALPDDVAKDGFAYGYSVDEATMGRAQVEALSQCRTTKDRSLRPLCKVITTYRDQCVAIAMDPADGTPGVGWAIAGDLSSAEVQALNKCKEASGPGRADKCTVDKSVCDGSPRSTNKDDSIDSVIRGGGVPITAGAPGPSGTHR